MPSIANNKVDFDKYGDHLLQVGQSFPLDGMKLGEDWMLVVFLLVIVGIVWIRVFHYKRLRQLFQAFFAKLYVAHIIRENDNLMNRVLWVLNVISLMVLGLFLYQLNSFYLLNITVLNHIPLFLITCIVIGLIYQIKAWSFQGLGFVFSKKDLADEYIFNVYLANKMVGLLLTPIVIGLAYIPFGKGIFINIGFAIIAIMYLFRLSRGVRIAIVKGRLSYFYLFLYLCTLEILPLAVLVRVYIESS